MGAQSVRQTLIWSLIATSIWSAILHFTTGGTILLTLATFPLLLLIMFLTMRMTNRVTARLTRRWLPQRRDTERLAAPEPLEATSLRPDHAQRRRSRRRRRRGRR